MHPDIAGNTETAVKKFKEINEAYESLSDKVKRAEYDTINRFYNYSSDKKETKKETEKKNNNFTQPEFKNTDKHKEKSGSTSGFNFNWEDFVAKYKEYTQKYEQSKTKETSEHKQAKYGNTKNGNDINTDVEISIAEAVNGTTKVINMLNTHVCSFCNGRKFINSSLCPHCKGKGEITDFKKFTIKIPAGIKNNSKIRLAGEGEIGVNGGRNGDLYITVHIKSPLDYKTDGNNIIKTVTLAPYEAVLGGKISVNTPDGNITVKISPNTQNGQKIRLSGCGLNINNKIGDMILIVEIQIPKNLSSQEIELYKKLKEFSSQNVK